MLTDAHAQEVFTVQYRDDAPGPEVWQTIPVAYPTLEEAIQAAKTHCRHNFVADATLVTTEPPDGLTAEIEAIKAGETATCMTYRVEKMFAMMPSPAG